MHDLVSIIIPVFKTNRDYLNKYIESVIVQTYTNIEILLIVDGEQKDFEACKMYERRDVRINIIFHEHQGVSRARNLGIEKASGEWLTFVDSDDWVAPNMIESLMKLNDIECNIIICDMYIHDKNNIVSNHFFHETRYFSGDDKKEVSQQCVYKVRKHKKIRNTVGVAVVKLYQTSFLKRNRIQFDKEISLGEDTIFALTAFRQANKIGYINSCYYHYMVYNTSSSNAIDYDVAVEIERFAHALLIECKKYNDQNLIDLYHARIAISVINCLRKDYANASNDKPYAIRISDFRKLFERVFIKNSLYKSRLSSYTCSRMVFILLLRMKCYNTVLCFSCMHYCRLYGHNK
ncbi:glycosyl transferase [Clostridia bacterium]|nr:glycosyl transferase [Clostridia bacterium]